MSEVETQDELTILKARADKMGIKYHPAIKLESLKAKITEKLEGTEAPAEEAVEDTAGETVHQMRIRLRKELTAKRRVTVVPMDPAKREWPGEHLRISNDVVQISEYVPFNTEEGWHISEMLYRFLKSRKCQVFKTVVDSRGNKIRKGATIPAFNVVDLPPLTPEQLAELAQRQAAKKTID
jgi:hypothetical protein